MDVFRADALKIAPVLAHLNPMPPAVTDALMRTIDDPKEPLVATAIVRSLAENKAPPREIVNRLVPKAFDPKASSNLRAAAIYAFAKLRPDDRSQLNGLLGISDDRIAGALIDVGLQ